MFRTSLFFLCALTALTQPAEQAVMNGNATLPSGAVFQFRSVLRPPGVSMRGFGAGGIFTDSNMVHRYMIDEDNHLCFGYDVVIGTPDSRGAVLVTFQPLSATNRINGISRLQAAPPPKLPAPQTLRNGEALELDLMVSLDETKRLTDIIAIETHESKPVAAQTTTTPRDYTVDDGPITWDASRYSFWKQGQETQTPGFTERPGKTLWLAVPGEGRYILSLTPHEGFTKAGTVRDNVVAFEVSGKQYELRFRSPIAGANKAWNLYVMSTPPRAADAPKGIQFGTDRLENLLTK